MNQLRLMQILKVAVANICDLSNGYEASTEALWDMYGELEKAIQSKQQTTADLTTKITEDLVKEGFIFFKGPLDGETPEERKRKVANRIYRTITET